MVSRDPLSSLSVVAAVAAAVAVAAVAIPASAGDLVSGLATQAPDLERDVLELAVNAVECARSKGVAGKGVLTVIDYSLPSTVPRLWVFDLATGRLLFHELVAHGKHTGENRAREFSNRHGSKQSSLGLFLTAGTYHGRNGYSLKLHGLEEGVNHNAWDRTIVLHGAWYVSEEFAGRHGRLGRSWGCPAVPRDVAQELIDTIKDGTYLFIYYPDADWLERSEFIHGCVDRGSETTGPASTAPDPGNQEAHR
jgi:hypothetical protein